jgi:hypothetical protein
LFYTILGEERRAGIDIDQREVLRQARMVRVEPIDHPVRELPVDAYLSVRLGTVVIPNFAQLA